MKRSHLKRFSSANINTGRVNGLMGTRQAAVLMPGLNTDEPVPLHRQPKSGLTAESFANNKVVSKVEDKFTRWNEKVLLETPSRKFALRFRAGEVVFVDINRINKTVCSTRNYRTVTDAMEVFQNVASELLGWGPLRPY